MGLRQKPIQEYRPTEESKAAPTANAGENAGLEDVLQVAEAENVIQEKLGLLRKEIQEMELSRTSLNEATKAQDSAKDDLSETMKAFYAAKDSADNIVTGIVAQIVRVENMHLTAHLDEGSVTQVQETNRKAIEAKLADMQSLFSPVYEGEIKNNTWLYQNGVWKQTESSSRTDNL